MDCHSGDGWHLLLVLSFPVMESSAGASTLFFIVYEVGKCIASCHPVSFGVLFLVWHWLWCEGSIVLVGVFMSLLPVCHWGVVGFSIPGYGICSVIHSFAYALYLGQVEALLWEQAPSACHSGLLRLSWHYTLLMCILCLPCCCSLPCLTWSPWLHLGP